LIAFYYIAGQTGVIEKLNIFKKEIKIKTKKVKDLMIPVEHYPIVSKDASLFDMILVLEEANNNLSSKALRRVHRY
jgi:hypothetical protein